MNKVTINIPCMNSFINISFHLLAKYLEMVLLGPVVAHTFIGNCQAVILNGFTILHSHQKTVRVPVALHPCLCLVLSPFI